MQNQKDVEEMGDQAHPQQPTMENHEHVEMDDQAAPEHAEELLKNDTPGWRPLPVLEPDHTNVRHSMLRSPTDLSLYCLPLTFPPGPLPPPVVSPAAADVSYHSRVRALHWDIYREQTRVFGLQFPYDERILENYPGVFAPDPVPADQDHEEQPEEQPVRRPLPALYRPIYTWVEEEETSPPAPENAPSRRRASARRFPYDSVFGSPENESPPTPYTGPPGDHWRKTGSLLQRVPVPGSTSMGTRDAFYPRLGHHTNLLHPEDAKRLWPGVVRERQESEEDEQIRQSEWKARRQSIADGFAAQERAILERFAATGTNQPDAAPGTDDGAA